VWGPLPGPVAPVSGPWGGLGQAGAWPAAAPPTRPGRVVVRLDQPDPPRPRDRGVHRFQEQLPARDPPPIAVLDVSEGGLIAVHTSSFPRPHRRASRRPRRHRENQRIPRPLGAAARDCSAALRGTRGPRAVPRTGPRASWRVHDVLRGLRRRHEPFCLLGLA
jgi:hypothetical protein